MKKEIYFIVIIFSFCRIETFSQDFNGDFATWDMTKIYPGNCPTAFYTHNGAPAVQNWLRSHGTPDLYMPDAKPYANYAYMWANSAGMGEGIFGGYTFVPHKTYLITIRAQSNAISGALNFFAASGVTESFDNSNCGQAVPNVSSKTAIGTITNLTNSWQEYTLSFVSAIPYSQIWLYPSTSSTAQLNSYVDYVFIGDDCNAAINYNIGTVPSGPTRAGFITAGSGSSSIVSLQSTANTVFQANNSITLTPEFTAFVSGTNTFSASIVSCNSSRVSQFPDSNRVYEDVSKLTHVSEGDIPKYSLGNEDDKFKIYPTFSKGIFNVNGLTMSKLANAKIDVYNEQGLKVYRGELHQTSINLEKLNNGLYVIQIYLSNGSNLSSKVIIQK